MKGRVYLVGAGPGDPDLLTVKAVRLLRTADAVLHDDLVSPQVLTLIASNAQLHNVGKRCGTKKISQQEINFLMIGLASLGMTVVRLKSGDPLIFGRLGEEITALRKAGIEFEIVPGVTSALAAAASVSFPLTDRNVSPAVILLAGHRASGNQETDWRKFVSSGATLVIYMPGHRYGDTAGRLRSAGMPADKPCAIISRATAPDQVIHITTVEQLAVAPRLPAPTLLVVGDVVKFSKHSRFSVTQFSALLAQSARTLQEEDSFA